MTLLPVSGLEAALRQPNGADELILCEATGSAVARSITFLSTLSSESDWAALTVTDFEIVLLRLREHVLGDVCDLGFDCPQCTARVEVSFRISDFLEGIRSRQPAGIEKAPGRTGWFTCDGVAFRLPTAGDQAAVAGRPDALRRLVERCIDTPNPPARLRGRIERAMAALAPEVSRPLVGSCPECGEMVEATFHVTRLVVGEFTREAANLHDEVDLIARAYHWREAEILQLPRQRRRAYAERIRQAA
jgi:hypothetical protein